MEAQNTPILILVLRRTMILIAIMVDHDRERLDSLHELIDPIKWDNVIHGKPMFPVKEFAAFWVFLVSLNNLRLNPHPLISSSISI